MEDFNIVKTLIDCIAWSFEIDIDDINIPCGTEATIVDIVDNEAFLIEFDDNYFAWMKKKEIQSVV